MVTFLFTDIEGSTRLWDERPEVMGLALSRHDALVRGAIEARSGYVFSTSGDGFAAAFARPDEAVMAAKDAQALLRAEPWPRDAVVRVRMGLHSGAVDERDGDYFGPAVNRAARVMAAGGGGQVLLSSTTAAMVGYAGLVDLGEQLLAGLAGSERIFQLGEGAFPPLRSQPAVVTNLSPERTSFVGRQDDLGVVAGLVRSARVVTLTGVGGVGKTRLATQVAWGLVDEFPDGVWLVELAPLIDGDLVPAAVASALAAQSVRGLEAIDVVCQILALKRALLVLDNCEHVIGSVADLVDRVLGAAPQLRVLTTSREPLGVGGESVWRVPSLSVEGPEGVVGDAVALFAERAAQAQPGFEFDDDAGREVVAQVCRRLDGIPLAIELAAARTKVMSVEQIATRLDERFRLLTRGGRTAVARQQTLQGTLDWSYELLSPAERELFDVLGVFAGDFDLGAVVSVSGRDEFEVLDLLQQLADKSMVEADPARDRYRLLETLRQYAWDRLVAAGVLTATRDAHAVYFFELAGEQGRLMGTPGRQLEALNRLEADYDNLRSALANLIDRRDAEAAARMVRRLGGLFNIRHPSEGLGWFEQVIAISDGLLAGARSRLFADAALAAMNAGNQEAQGRYARESIELGSDDAPAAAYTQLSGWCLAHDSVQTAVEVARQAVIAADRTNNLTDRVLARISLVVALGELGSDSGVRSEISVLMGLAETLASPTLLVAAYFSCGEALDLIGDANEALATFRAGLTHAELAGPEMWAQAHLFCALQVNDVDEAARLLRRALDLSRRDELSYASRLHALLTAATYAFNTGSAIEAAQLLGTYQDQASRYGGFAQPLRTRRSKQLMTELAASIPPDQLDQEIRTGAGLSVEKAIGRAYDMVTRDHAPRE
jgi:predicted ATPase/class 3 adenylate cyclase